MLTLEEAKARHPGAEPCTFGDGGALTEEINRLVREGAKTATCALAAAFGDAPLPKPGDRWIMLTPEGAPVQVIETVEVRRLTFDTMTEALVPEQGEFADLEDWRGGFRAYLTRQGQFAPNVPMIREKFRRVEVLG